MICYTTGKQENQDDESIAVLLVRRARGVHLPFLKMGNWAAFLEIMADFLASKRPTGSWVHFFYVYVCEKKNEFTENYMDINISLFKETLFTKVNKFHKSIKNRS